MKKVVTLAVLIAVGAVMMGVGTGVLIQKAMGAEDEAAAGEGGAKAGSGILAIAIALSTGLGCLGAGYAVAQVGSAALGATSENPEMFGRSLVFVGLAEGIAIYGLIIAIMLLGKM